MTSKGSIPCRSPYGSLCRFQRSDLRRLPLRATAHNKATTPTSTPVKTSAGTTSLASPIRELPYPE